LFFVEVTKNSFPAHPLSFHFFSGDVNFSFMVAVGYSVVLCKFFFLVAVGHSVVLRKFFFLVAVGHSVVLCKFFFFGCRWL
jgi:hypothetical protein